jgi:hypothetical protein
MPSQSLTTSIREPGEHFGGVSDPYFTSAWSHWTGRPVTLELLTVDDGPLGKAQFRTTVEITGDTAAQLSPSAVYRIVCLYVLGHLKEEPLREACQTLYELYEAQLEQMNTPPASTPNVQRINVAPIIKQVERPSFEIGE